MDGVEFAAQFEHWANEVLIWVGFGTLTGLLAKAIMPGRDPGGPVATLAMGICGAIIGCGAFSFFFRDMEWVRPISPMGFLLATAGAFVILAFFRVLGGYWFEENGVPLAHRERPLRRRRRRRRRVPVDVDEYEY